MPSALPAALASVALLAATAATAAADRAPWEKQEERSTALRSVVRTVVVDVDAGSVVLRQGRPARVETTSTWFRTKPEVTVSLRDGALTVKSRCPDYVKGLGLHVGDPLGSCRTDVSVFLAGLPRDVAVGTGAGDVAVAGVRGPLRLRSGFGDLAARQLRGGPVKLSAEDGDVDLVDVVASSLQATSAMGDTRVNRVRTSGTTTIHAYTGAISGAALVAPTLQVLATQGSAQLVDVRARSVSLHSAGGPAILNDSRVGTADLRAEGSAAHAEGTAFRTLSVVGGTGTLVSTKQRFQRLQVTTGDGSVEAVVPAGRYALALRSDNGRISLNGVVADAHAAASISVGSTGDITLRGR